MALPCTTLKDPLNGARVSRTTQFPPTGFDPNSSKLLSIFPLPNTLGAQATACSCNFQIAGSENMPVKQEMLRVDYNVTEKARLWFKASGFSSDNTGLTSAAIDNQWGPAPVDYQQTMPFLGANFTYVFSPTLVNELSLGMNLWTEDQILTKARAGRISASQLRHQYPADLSVRQSGRAAACDVFRRHHQRSDHYLRWTLPHGGRFDAFAVQRLRHQDLA